jgi:Flp pilus assembly pilin Flp
VRRRALAFRGPADTHTNRTKPAHMHTRRLSKLNNTSAQTMTEYALILAFVFLIVVVAIPIFANVVVSLFDSVMNGFGS